jgi:hypothetical protein
MAAPNDLPVEDQAYAALLAAADEMPGEPTQEDLDKMHPAMRLQYGKPFHVQMMMIREGKGSAFPLGPADLLVKPTDIQCTYGDQRGQRGAFTGVVDVRSGKLRIGNLDDLTFRMEVDLRGILGRLRAGHVGDQAGGQAGDQAGSANGPLDDSAPVRGPY